MTRWTKRKMYLDEATGLYRSHTSDRVLTPAQYEARCAQGKIAAAAQKEIAAYLASDEWKEIEAESSAKMQANANKPLKLPGWDGWDVGFYMRRGRRS